MDLLRGDPRFDAILRRIHLRAFPVAKARVHATKS